MGIMNDNKKEDLNQIYNLGQSVYIDMINSQQSQYIQIMPNKKSISEIVKKKMFKKEKIDIKFEFDTQNQSIEIMDEFLESHYEYSIAKVKN